jgi:hypothetical protein
VFVDIAQRLLSGCRGLALSGLILLPVVGACAEPEPSSYTLTITSIGTGEICADGADTDERCFPPDDLSLVDGTPAHLGDCVVVEVTGDGRTDVARASWNGRCSPDAVRLGATLWDGQPRVIIPDCLGSFVSLRLEDASGSLIWSVARETSTQHPLIQHVTLGEIPPGFAERDPLIAPEPGAELTVTATQQIDLPDATGRFTVDQLDEDVTDDGRSYPTADAFVAESGCPETD